MSGFAKAIINDDEMNKLIKRYKKIKKYMRSTLYEMKTLDGTEQIVSKLLEDTPNG
jgi:negative regulator of sigma E activity